MCNNVSDQIIQIIQTDYGDALQPVDRNNTTTNLS